jgi:hypothetical protein
MELSQHPVEQVPQNTSIPRPFAGLLLKASTRGRTAH